MYTALAYGPTCVRTTLPDGGLCFRYTYARFREHLTLRDKASRRLAVVAHATHTECSEMVERVLRYPDGHVRTIRYPGPSASRTPPRMTRGMGAQMWPQPSSPPSPQGDWHICSEMDDSCSFDPAFNEQLDLPGAAPVEELWGARRESQNEGVHVISGSPAQCRQDTQPVEEFGALPSSPAALLEYLSSDKFAAERRKLQDKVARSYEVLHGCPWLYPRTLVTVAIRKEGQENPSSYTLPVATEQEGSAGEMAKLLKIPHLEKALQMRNMQDGIIAFDCDMAAAQFLDSLHGAGSLSASLTEVDAHELFRATADAKAAVVLVCGDDSPSRGDVSSGLEDPPTSPKPIRNEHKPFAQWPSPSEPISTGEEEVYAVWPNAAAKPIRKDEEVCEQWPKLPKQQRSVGANERADWPSLSSGGHDGEPEVHAEWPSSLVRRSVEFVPTPAQLAAALRGKSMEDW